MPDIFLSYSRKNSVQALALADRLRMQGISVWIDQSGIEAAASWSREIVKAIDECSVFLVLLSEDSNQSSNVIREVSLASESGKKLLPVVLDDIRLSDDLRYHLAGIQRVAFTQFEAITQALNSFGIARTRLASADDNRKSLLVMPFDDLSPAQDSQWFAEGLAGELIDKLTHVHSLRVIDRRTSRDLRTSSAGMYEIAATLGVHYIVEGSIRKFGDQIKISTALLDTHEGEYLWQESFKGVMEDVFELQERVAQSVVDTLQLNLLPEEQTQLERNETQNVSAYEYLLKGLEAMENNSRASMEHALHLFAEAAALDPTYGRAYVNMASAHIFFAKLDAHAGHEDRALAAIDKVQRLEGESTRWSWLMSRYHFNMNNLREAEHFARLVLQRDPSFHQALDVLSGILAAKGDVQGAIDAAERVVQLAPESPARWFTLLLLISAGSPERLEAAAIEALPVFSRHLKLYPHHSSIRIQFGVITYWAGDRAGALKVAEDLIDDSDGGVLYNVACLLTELGEQERAHQVFRQAIIREPQYLQLLRADDQPRKKLKDIDLLILELEQELGRAPDSTLP